MKVKRAFYLAVAVAATVVGIVVLAGAAKAFGDFYEMPEISMTRAVVTILILIVVAAALLFEAYRMVKFVIESKNSH